MTLPISVKLAVVAIVMEFALLGAGGATPSRADHGSYVVQPVYFFASDQSNRFTTYQTKLNGYMSEVTNWYKLAHLSTGDSFKMNQITFRQGVQTKAQYCSPAPVATCNLNDVWGKVWNDLGNPALSSYLGYNPATAKNVITVVFFDTIGGGFAGLASARSNPGPYNPAGLGGTPLYGAYVMDSGSKGTAGHDGTIAHEIGHTLRLPHNADSGNIWGNCALMGFNVSSCWDGSSFLVNGQGTDGYWYLEKYAVHYSPFTRIDGATSPPSSMLASRPACGQILFQWSLLGGDSTTGQTLLVAPMSSLQAYGGILIRPANIFTGTNRTVVPLSAAESSHKLSNLAPGTYYWTVAPANSVGHVHGWPTAEGGFVLTC